MLSILIGAVLTFSISRTWPLEVWGVKTRLPKPGLVFDLTKKVSQSSRAGWFLGIFRDSKAYQSQSISGYEACEKPSLAKMATISSIACETGCRWPMDNFLPGAVISMNSL